MNPPQFPQSCGSFEFRACVPELYARAQQLFLAKGDARDALHAKVGRLRSNAETISFVDLSRFLGEQLQRPMVKEDRALRLWCLIAKGYSPLGYCKTLDLEKYFAPAGQF